MINVEHILNLNIKLGLLNITKAESNLNKKEAN